MPRFRKLGAGRFSRTSPGGSLDCRKMGEWKLSTSFPLAVWDSSDKSFRRTAIAKECGEAGRGTSAFEMVLSPLKQLKEYCFCCAENSDLFR